MNEEIARKIEELRKAPEAPKPHPEQAGPEFYEAGQRPAQPFRPDYAAAEHSDKVTEIIAPEVAAPAPAEMSVHTEAGIPLPNEITTEAGKREAVEKLMAMGQTSKIDANDLNASLEQLLRDRAA